MKNLIYFSICRYVPSIFRGESVNIGIAYHIPSLQMMDFIATRNIRRLKSFDDEVEIEMINAIFESLKYEFGESTLEYSEIDYEEYEALDLTNEKLLEEMIQGYVNQIQFSEVKVFEAKEDISESIKDLFDMILYYDKKKSERISQDRVRALAARIVSGSSYKNSMYKVSKSKGFFDIPYDFTYEKNGVEKYIKAFSFDYKQPWRFYKEVKAYLFDLDHALKEGMIKDLSNVKIVINNTELEQEHEKEIAEQLPKEIELVTLSKFSNLLVDSESSGILQ